MWVLAGNIVQLQGPVRLHDQSETILVPKFSCGGICQNGVVCICTKTLCRLADVSSVNLKI
jgi:hypothetical protein